ncbi:MAG: hypothetical protein ABI693_02610 [Bryobacteraceae bacterium]
MRSLLLCLLLAVPVFPQDVRSPFFPSWDPAILKELSLNSRQQRDILATIDEYRARLVEQRRLLDKAQTDIEEGFNKDSFDQRRNADACEKLIAARADLARTFSQMQIHLRSILTADQWRKLKERSAR